MFQIKEKCLEDECEHDPSLCWWHMHTIYMVLIFVHFFLFLVTVLEVTMIVYVVYFRVHRTDRFQWERSFMLCIYLYFFVFCTK